MASIWTQQNDEEGGWAVTALDGDRETFFLTGDPQNPVSAQQSEGAEQSEGAAGGDVCLLRRLGLSGTEAWTLVAPDGTSVSINGEPVILGMRVLRDRDEIRVGQREAVFFSTEQLAIVEDFPGIGKVAPCPRCKQHVDVGSRAVRCPRCSMWYHEEADLPCWTYDDVCSVCGRQTDLEMGFSWTPEDL